MPDRQKKSWDNDTELVDEILGGSVEHFDLLYEQYFPRVYRFALKRLRDPAEAEDVTQEVFMTVFSVLPSYRGASSLLVWIFGITRNTVNRRFRKARPTLVSVDGDSADRISIDQPPIDQVVEARRVLRHCESIIDRDLTPLQRRIFHLKHLRRQSIRSIAAALGKSEDAIKANLYRIRCCIHDAVPALETVLHN